MNEISEIWIPAQVNFINPYIIQVPPVRKRIIITNYRTELIGKIKIYERAKDKEWSSVGLNYFRPDDLLKKATTEIKITSEINEIPDILIYYAKN